MYRETVTVQPLLLWSGAVLIIGIANVVQPRRAGNSLRQVAVGTAYAVADVAVGGALGAWPYNRFSSESEAAGLTGAEQPQVGAVRSAG